MPARKPAKSIMDGRRPIVEGCFEGDARTWRKQRHAAKRIFERLRDGHGRTASESTVRHCVAGLRGEYEPPASPFLTLVWAPGEAQAGFGEAGFYLNGVRARLSFPVVAFPFSNVGLAQVFPGQNAECVCQGPKSALEFVGGVPARIAFGDAAGIGGKAADGFGTARLFAAFAARYGLDFSFCNPGSGHEKGSVENRVGFVGRGLFVPAPGVANLAAYNERLMPRCPALSEGRPRRSKGEPEPRLLVEDRSAMPGLPAKGLGAVGREASRTDEQGRFRLGRAHVRSTSPEPACTEAIVGIGADTVGRRTPDGRPICKHRRAHGSAPTGSEEPASRPALPCAEVSAWPNSQVRASLPERLRGRMDGLCKQGLKAELRIMRDQAAQSGRSVAVGAMGDALASTGRIDEASVAAAAAASGAVAYDEPVDPGAHGRALSLAKGARPWP